MDPQETLPLCLAGHRRSSKSKGNGAAQRNNDVGKEKEKEINRIWSTPVPCLSPPTWLWLALASPGDTSREKISNSMPAWLNFSSGGLSHKQASGAVACVECL